ncbi:unnamed protein product [Calypogeia fissa]
MSNRTHGPIPVSGSGPPILSVPSFCAQRSKGDNKKIRTTDYETADPEWRTVDDMPTCQCIVTQGHDELIEFVAEF